MVIEIACLLIPESNIQVLLVVFTIECGVVNKNWRHNLSLFEYFLGYWPNHTPINIEVWSRKVTKEHPHTPWNSIRALVLVANAFTPRYLNFYVKAKTIGWNSQISAKLIGPLSDSIKSRRANFQGFMLWVL